MATNRALKISGRGLQLGLAAHGSGQTFPPSSAGLPVIASVKSGEMVPLYIYRFINNFICSLILKVTKSNSILKFISRKKMLFVTRGRK